MIYIYILVDPITNDIKYCGKTNNIKVRLTGHLKEKKYNIEKSEWIKNIKSLGLKPTIEIIDEVDDNDWDFWEKYWISQLKTWGFNLFNKTDGGEYSVTGFNHTAESKDKISKSQLGRKISKEWRKNISEGRKGIKFSDNHLKNLSLSHIGQISNNKKSIYQIDINNGEILNKFDSITNAYKYLKLDIFNSGLISSACKNKVKSAYGYYWCYDNEYDNFIFKEYHRKYNPILQFDKNGNFIKEYSNIKNAAKENNLNQCSISHALNEEPSCGGFIWFHKYKYNENTLKNKINKIKKNYILYQLDLKNNEILKTFNSIKEAEEKTNIKHIGLVLSGKRNHAGGYKWIRTYI